PMKTSPTTGNRKMHEWPLLRAAATGLASIFISATAHAGLYSPAGPNANLYVSNYNGDTIEKYSSTGIDLGMFANTGLNNPTGLAFDSAGNLYAANRDTNRIEKFSPTGSVFANTGLNQPYGLAFDSTGNLYAANFGDN